MHLDLLICVTHALLAFQASAATDITATTSQSPSPVDLVGQHVAVQLDSQRVVRGILDEKSDDETVWVRRSSDRVTLWSGFPRSRVVSVQVAAPAEPADAHAAADVDRNVVESVVVEDKSVQIDRRAVSVEVFAQVANFDADAESDGLRVWVRPVDRSGDTVEMSGDVEFQLLGDRRDWRGGRHDPRGPQFIELASWARRLRAEDLTSDGYFTTLEFRNFHPERDLNVAAEALLQVRLSVPGQGVLNASYDRLDLRPWNALRDDLQQSTGSRFFPQERPSVRPRR